MNTLELTAWEIDSWIMNEDPSEEIAFDIMDPFDRILVGITAIGE